LHFHSVNVSDDAEFVSVFLSKFYNPCWLWTYVSCDKIQRVQHVPCAHGQSFKHLA